MINFLNKIFTDRNYSVSETCFIDEQFDILLIEEESSLNKEEYYLIVQPKFRLDDCINLLLSEKIDLFESKIKPLKAGIIKNCTLILCDSHNLSNSDILMFEEDPFSFKKNVITYSTEQLNNLIDLVTDKKFSNSLIGSIISADAGDKFDNFKEGKMDKNDHYHLVMMLSIKLPLLKYNNSISQLYDVESVITEKLNAPQLLLKENCLASDLLDMDNDALEETVLGWGVSSDL
ncbi:hypothetical protein CXF72_13140 [Psychromonas sp. MB-3u-54]|jgi:hypothetical protein|uniref:ABC-three component system middle component 1 n=1 Tax=Psychromonas sp. MB-3u-54 TaxID=2058319 RepID=UPI000C34E08A|nr:ABC-three component system middle component 1 [Psychromonas sp. MB-3u-54]PKH02144.1 hypothetical protein CXF72_13140 [Psychromonas sp. MB-3u-54]